MPNPEMTPVISGHVQAVGYDKAAKELHVQFKNGDHVKYRGVEEPVFGAIRGSKSIGGALHEHVKGRFPFEYVSKSPREK